MIVKDKAPGGNPEPENQTNGLTNSNPSNYLKVSIVSLETKLLVYLVDHKGWISTHRLFERLGLDILEMSTAARVIHNLGRRGIIEIRANAVRAARGIKRAASHD